MTWLETTNAIVELPTWAERIAALEQLAPSPAITVAQIVDTFSDPDVEVETGDDYVTFWSVCARVLPRVLSPAELFEVVTTLSDVPSMDASQLVEYIFNQQPRQYLAAAVAGLATRPTEALHQIARCWEGDSKEPAAVVSAWPQIDALAAENLTAAMLCIRGQRVSPEIVRRLARELETRDLAIESYDEQLEIEQLLGHVECGGPVLRDLAPLLVRFLRCDAMAYRTKASAAAVGLQASSLRPEIEQALQRAETIEDDLSREVEASHHLYALWGLGGPAEYLTRATDVAGDNVVARFRLSTLFARSGATPRILDGLREIAEAPKWRGLVCGALAKLGAREQLAAVTPPTVDDNAYLDWVEACYRAGIATREETRARVEQKLDRTGWALYGELAVADPIAFERIRAEIERSTPEMDEESFAVFAVLAKHPELDARLAPLLRERGFDWQLFVVWSTGVSV